MDTIAKKNGYNKKAKAVLRYLNRKKGSKYSDYSLIVSRLKSGATIRECITVINNKLADDYFQKKPKYLRPKTLFAKSNFDSYLNDTPHPLQGKVSETTQQNIETLKKWRPKNEG